MYKKQAVIAYFYSFVGERTAEDTFLLFFFRLSRFSRLLAKEENSFPNAMSVPSSEHHNSVPEGLLGLFYCFIVFDLENSKHPMDVLKKAQGHS